jgi:hypothetical protein
MAKSPVVIPFSTDGTEIALKDATALPASARGYVGIGIDGATSRFIKVDSAGQQFVHQGSAAALSDAWPVKISDGVDFVGISTVGGTKAIKVDVVQSVGSAGGTSSSYGAAFPAVGTGAGFNDGSFMQGARVFDVDSGAGTQYVLGVVLRKSASGGSIELGTATDPIRVDPTGTTTQPISGSVSITGSVIPGTGSTNLGKAEDAPHTSGDVGVFALAVRNDALAALSSTDLDYTPISVTSSGVVRVDPSGTTTQPVSDAGSSLTVDTTQLPGALVGGRLDTNVGTWLGSTAPTIGQKTMASSLPIVIASDQSAIPISGSVTTTPSTVGTHGNAWNAAAVSANGTSASVDAQNTAFISIFGNTSGSTKITMQVSQNDTDFYDAVTLNTNGNFYMSETVGARYIRLKSSEAVTITATITGKS